MVTYYYIKSNRGIVATKLAWVAKAWAETPLLTVHTVTADSYPEWADKFSWV